MNLVMVHQLPPGQQIHFTQEGRLNPHVTVMCDDACLVITQTSVT